jgi:NDP-sugar pyrophosphorylase family protein
VEGRIKHALIMAAGRGARMAPLTDAMPKPMAPYMGTTLIASGIDKLRPHIPNIHITVGYKGAMLAQHVIEHDVTSVFNTEGRTNSWWLYHTLMRFLDEPVYLLTCDNVLELDFALLEENYFDLGCPPNMVVPVPVVDGLDGDFIEAEDHVVTRLGRDFKSDVYCSGIQVVNPRRVNEITTEGESFYDTWSQLIQQRLLAVSSIYPERWMAVDTVEQLLRLHEISK